MLPTSTLLGGLHHRTNNDNSILVHKLRRRSATFTRTFRELEMDIMSSAPSQNDRYKAAWPTHHSIDGQEAYAQFLEQFYAISDTPGADDRWLEQFTADATVIMASRSATGTDEILSLRKGMWVTVASRQHTPAQIFVFSSDASGAEIMLHGRVAYTFKSGGAGELPWAGRAHLVRSGEGIVRMSFYQVYFDTAAQKAS
ncbi:hypothetical protein ANO11243_082790 [Dothideomycetidae sp. 11243]|nr:hypothetical protein ANO11243_082790 [fungal sp. No.11243]